MSTSRHKLEKPKAIFLSFSTACEEVEIQGLQDAACSALITSLFGDRAGIWQVTQWLLLDVASTLGDPLLHLCFPRGDKP